MKPSSEPSSSNFVELISGPQVPVVPETVDPGALRAQLAAAAHAHPSNYMSAAGAGAAATVQGRPVYILSNVQPQAASAAPQASVKQEGAAIKRAPSTTSGVGPAHPAPKSAPVVQQSTAKGVTAKAQAASDTAQQPKTASAPAGGPKSSATAPKQPMPLQAAASKQVTPQVTPEQHQPAQSTSQPVSKRRPASANDLALVFQDPEGQAPKKAPAGQQQPKERESAANSEKGAPAATGESGQHVALVPMARCSICRGFFPADDFPGFKKLQPNETPDKVPKHCAPCVRLLASVKDASWGTETKIRELLEKDTLKHQIRTLGRTFTDTITTRFNPHHKHTFPEGTLHLMPLSAKSINSGDYSAAADAAEGLSSILAPVTTQTETPAPSKSTSAAAQPPQAAAATQGASVPPAATPAAANEAQKNTDTESNTAALTEQLIKLSGKDRAAAMAQLTAMLSGAAPAPAAGAVGAAGTASRAPQAASAPATAAAAGAAPKSGAPTTQPPSTTAPSNGGSTPQGGQRTPTAPVVEGKPAKEAAKSVPAAAAAHASPANAGGAQKRKFAATDTAQAGRRSSTTGTAPDDVDPAGGTAATAENEGGSPALKRQKGGGKLTRSQARKMVEADAASTPAHITPAKDANTCAPDAALASPKKRSTKGAQGQEATPAGKQPAPSAPASAPQTTLASTPQGNKQGKAVSQDAGKRKSPGDSTAQPRKSAQGATNEKASGPGGLSAAAAAAPTKGSSPAGKSATAAAAADAAKLRITRERERAAAAAAAAAAKRASTGDAEKTTPTVAKTAAAGQAPRAPDRASAPAAITPAAATGTTSAQKATNAAQAQPLRASSAPKQAQPVSTPHMATQAQANVAKTPVNSAQPLQGQQRAGQQIQQQTQQQQVQLQAQQQEQLQAQHKARQKVLQHAQQQADKKAQQQAQQKAQQQAQQKGQQVQGQQGQQQVQQVMQGVSQAQQQAMFQAIQQAVQQAVQKQAQSPLQQQQSQNSKQATASIVQGPASGGSEVPAAGSMQLAKQAAVSNQQATRQGGAQDKGTVEMNTQGLASAILEGHLASVKLCKSARKKAVEQGGLTPSEKQFAELAEEHLKKINALLEDVF